MRGVLFADLDAALRVLMQCPQEGRADMADTLIAQAHLADRYRKHLRKPHPAFGTGTLMSAAARHPQAARLTRLDDAAVQSLQMLLGALASHRVN